MDQSVVRAASRPLRLSLFAVGAALVWSALGLILSATSASAATADDTLLPGDPRAPAISRALEVVPQVTTAVAPVAAAVPHDLATSAVPALDSLPVVAPALDSLTVVAAVAPAIAAVPATIVPAALPTDAPTVAADSVAADAAGPVGQAVPERLGSPSRFASAANPSATAVESAAPSVPPVGTPLTPGDGPAALPAPPGVPTASGAGNGPQPAAESPDARPAAHLPRSRLSSSGREALPSSPTFDPGSTPD